MVRPAAPPEAREGADPAAELLLWQRAWGGVARQLNDLIDHYERTRDGT